jgi:hypothetical protein
MIFSDSSGEHSPLHVVCLVPYPGDHGKWFCTCFMHKRITEIYGYKEEENLHKWLV